MTDSISSKTLARELIELDDILADSPNRTAQRRVDDARQLLSGMIVRAQRLSPEASAPTHWRCFHCGDVLTSEVDGENHFGRREGAEPACKIKAAGEFALLQALRNAEDELERYRAEDSDVLRAMHSMAADHQVALRREEERGYERGLRDARLSPETSRAPCTGCSSTPCVCEELRRSQETGESRG